MGEYWETEKNVLLSLYMKSKKIPGKRAKTAVRQLTNLAESTKSMILKLYMEKCKALFSFKFLTWRL